MHLGKTSKVRIRMLALVVFVAAAACVSHLLLKSNILLRDSKTVIEPASLTVLSVLPKENGPEECAEAIPYTYVQVLSYKQMTLHSQVPMRPEFFNLKDTELLAGFILSEWTNKFGMSTDKAEEYMSKVRNLHVVLAGSKEEFDKIIGIYYPDTDNVIGIIVSNSLLCFEVPENTGEYTIFLTPRSYDITMTNKPARSLIHELVHLASKVFDGNINSGHDNKKLWVKHDKENSIVALAQKQYYEFLLSKNKEWL